MTLTKKTVLVGIVGLALASSAVARTEPNSFLNRPANSHPELMKQLSEDEQVMDRFMRHFGMTRQEVLAMASNLQMARLPQDSVYLVYNVSPQEEIRARVMFYKKGTLVWVDPMGRPVLKVSCANPMMRGTDDGSNPLTTTIAPTSTEVVRPLSGELGETIIMTNEADVVLPGVPEASPMEFMSMAPEAPGLVRSSSSFGFLSLIPLAGGIILSRNNRGGENPVPEPTTMIVMGGALAAAAMRRRRTAK